MSIVKVSNRHFNVTTVNNGDIMELGPATTHSQVGAMVIQFAPSVDFAGSFKVMGKVLGKSGTDAPFLPIPYRRININAAVSDYAIVADDIVPAALIQVPANGQTIGLLATCTAGSCQVFSWDVQGSSAI